MKVFYWIMTVIGTIVMFGGIVFVADETLDTISGVVLFVIGFIMGLVFISLALSYKAPAKKKKAKKAAPKKHTPTKTNAIALGQTQVVSPAQIQMPTVAPSKVSKPKSAKHAENEPIKRYDYDCTDESYEKWEKDFRTFLNNVNLPNGLEEFLNKFKSSRKRCVLTQNKKSYHRIAKVYSFEKLKEKNIDFQTDWDFFKQFKGVLIFGFDEYGHGYFFLSFENNPSCPQVLYIDDEMDELILLGNSFEEFLQNLRTAGSDDIDAIDERIDEALRFGLQFKYNEYPEINEALRPLNKYRRQLERDVKGAYENIKAFEQGDFPKLVFDTFNGKVDYLVWGEKGKIMPWSEVIGNDYSKLDSRQKVILTNIIEGRFIYRLPPEYYNDPYNEYPKIDNKNRKTK